MLVIILKIIHIYVLTFLLLGAYGYRVIEYVPDFYDIGLGTTMKQQAYLLKYFPLEDIGMYLYRITSFNLMANFVFYIYIYVLLVYNISIIV